MVIKAFDILGREVATLVNVRQELGFYEVEFNCHSGACRNLRSGIYFYRLKVGASTLRQAQRNASSATGYTETKKMILMK